MGLITKVALSKYGQKFYKFVADPKNEKLVNNITPTLESAVATAVYCYATARQKNIDEDRRALLQWQNIGSGVVGIAIGSLLNNKVSKYADKVIPHLDQKVIPDAHKVVAGIKIFLPLASTCILMRCLIPSVVAWFSGKAEEVRRAKKATKDSKLNVVA